MEAIIFVGIPATGKSTFYKQRFADTHLRINGDMLGNKGLERELIEACLKHEQPFVVDKMNFTRKHRANYLEWAKAKWFKRIGYYFRSEIGAAIRRNANADRAEKDLPEIALTNAHRNLQLPSYTEGFDELHYVEMDEASKTFIVKPWEH